MSRKGQPGLSAGLIQLFDGVSEHRSRHDWREFLQEDFEGLAIAIAHLAQHPADSLMNQIVFVAQQLLGDRKRVFESTIAHN